ncbi:hypothetical protein HY643_03235 [Candidatus Woesearchaeota archaeon]|nr:hypothetical protein [Candidatus Woesearchaeota archaeon]
MLSKKDLLPKLGKYCFIYGVVIAVLTSFFFAAYPLLVIYTAPILVIFGLVVGFLNVGGKETKDFLLMIVAIIIMFSMAGSGLAYLTNIKYIGAILTNIMAFILPAGVVVALRDIYHLAAPKK